MAKRDGWEAWIEAEAPGHVAVEKDFKGKGNDACLRSRTGTAEFSRGGTETQRGESRIAGLDGNRLPW